MNRLFIFVVLVGFACRQQSETKELDPEKLRSELLPTEVRTATVAYRPFPYVITTTGQLQATWDVPIVSTTAGVVKVVFFQNGSRVKKGQVLLELENERQQIQVERARLTVEERKVTFQDMLLGHQGKKDSVTSVIVVENMRLASGLAAAELAYREALLDYESTRIKAVYDGLLTDWKVVPGTSIAGGQVVGRVFSPDRFLVVCQLLEQDALRLTNQSVAELQVAGITHVVNADRPEVNARVDSKTNLVEVSFRVQGGPALLPGLSAKITIRVPGQRALVVPKEAVVFRSGKAVVFTVENGLAKWNYVKAGSENGKEVEITEGLREGMPVIITNNLQLAHDAPVREI
jgi:RND family efflux transporter MFP subunit